MDEESGSVIGVVLGTQLVNQVEGVKGWGVPAEMIFEVSLLHLWKTIVYKLTPSTSSDVQSAGSET